MTELDKALEALQKNKRNHENQSRFYDLFLNSDFYIPTKMGQEPQDEGDAKAYPHGMPLVIEAEGDDFLVLFDTRERLYDWAQCEAPFLIVPGHVIAETSNPPLHWVLNLNTEHMKIFVPDEIAWLKDAVLRCKKEAGEAQ